MAKKRQEIKLDTSRLKRLPQADETWEADFRALPKPPYQNPTYYRGIVVTKKGEVLAESHVEGRPKASDLAALLTQAMQRPATGSAHRPSRLYVRGNRQWRELSPLLKDLGIKVSVRQELPKVKKVHEDYLRQMREANRGTMVKPTREQQTVEELFPTIAKWVRYYGHIEIGDQEMFGFVARALDYGGWLSKTTGPRHWPRQWLFWIKDWPSISSEWGSSESRPRQPLRRLSRPLAGGTIHAVARSQSCPH